MTEPSLAVSEIFGPTVSGEGPTLGQRCAFLRLMGCNLHCTWCDTPYTWDGTRYDLLAEGRRMAWTEIAGELVSLGTDFVIISGGEPLLHQSQPAWGRVLRALAGAEVRVEIETNGTRAPSPLSLELVHRFTVSPKLAHAGDPEADRIVPEVISAFRESRKADFKFVCRTADDVAEVQRWVKHFRLPEQRVWIMPEGTDTRTLCGHLAAVADPAVAAGFHVTTRLHIHAWGDERGR